MNQPNGWEALKRTLPIGSRVSCTVEKHFPFGIFVSIPDIKFVGLIEIVSFKDEGRMTTDQFPAIGSNITAVVLGFKDQGNQIWLSVKPSQVGLP